MEIRWRLATAAIQLALLLAVTHWVTGDYFVENPWFIAGLLSIVINPHLIETFYVRPGHVIANVIIFLFLFEVATKTPASGLGWKIAAVAFAALGILALLGLIVGRQNAKSRVNDFAFAARQLSQIAGAEVVFSAVFFLDLLSFRPSIDTDFWVLSATWASLLALGQVNWQRIWTVATVGAPTCSIEGLLGPSILAVSAKILPDQGSWVSINSRTARTEGLVLRRISRKEDVWAQIHVSDPKICEALLSEQFADVSECAQPVSNFVGCVEAGSTDRSLRFVTTKPLQTGQVVGVHLSTLNKDVMYQITSGEVERIEVKNGAHLFVRTHANQLGVFDVELSRIKRHLWVPDPGAPVADGMPNSLASFGQAPAGSEVLGHVIGTRLPVYLSLAAASEGHLAVLGMTKMGKSTLAERLARKLAERRFVTILDLTGEYVGKKGFPRFVATTDISSPGVCVFEPKQDDVPAERALHCLRHLLRTATPEYLAGDAFPRTIIIDEAHQFIPEPAGMGFGAPGRDSSIAFGLLMMQIRKYGISIILISQRTAVVAKSALSQCENLIAFRSVDQTGLDYLEAIAGGDVRTILPTLQQGQALAFGPAISSDSPVAVQVGTD